MGPAGHQNEHQIGVPRTSTARLGTARPRPADWLGAGLFTLRSGPERMKTRYPLMQRGSRVRIHARLKLEASVASKLATGRIWSVKESFQQF